ncbi:hypothetical protein BBF96_13235 [Anoxybacter fermentans]|uniref:Metal-binding protein n=1 Tax=Anoxybacter fermentans TaxID=1323375 RepID=A0A3S9T181_9FIRM|nr:DUF2284 domain-containing protein [Anoxybacter fermentans]AZR74280.1 hypothetical protein BBF96_13235 [Anoxybacter fermentans]
MKPEITTFEYVHKTCSGNQYPIQIGYHRVDPLNIPIDRKTTLKACRKGCKLYSRNGGCPPYAPDFAELRQKYSDGVIIFARLFTRYYPEKVLKGNYYVRWVLVETLLSRLMTQIGHKARERIGGFFLNTGHCIGCKKCAFKEGKKVCVNPEKRTFSMESTGILVTDLVKQELGFELQWWKSDKPEYIPEYMTKVILLLGKEPIDLREIEAILPKRE